MASSTRRQTLSFQLRDRFSHSLAVRRSLSCRARACSRASMHSRCVRQSVAHSRTTFRCRWHGTTTARDKSPFATHRCNDCSVSLRHRLSMMDHLIQLFQLSSLPMFFKNVCIKTILSSSSYSFHE